MVHGGNQSIIVTSLLINQLINQLISLLIAFNLFVWIVHCYLFTNELYSLLCYPILIVTMHDNNFL